MNSFKKNVFVTWTVPELPVYFPVWFVNKIYADDALNDSL